MPGYYRDSSGNAIYVGNEALNPDLIAGRTRMPDNYDPYNQSTWPTDSINSGNLNPGSSTDYYSPNYSSIYNVGGLNSDPYGLTGPEQEAQEYYNRLRGLTDQLAGQSAYRTSQENAAGLPDLLKTQKDLATRLKALQNEAQAIPLQMQQQSEGRGITAGGLQPLQTGALRNNAIQALSTSSLLEASRGNISTALDLVDRAVAQKFDPIKEEIMAKQQNLNLILNSPEYTNAQKQRAQIQLDLQEKKKRERDNQQDNYKTAQAMAAAAITNNPGNQAASIAAQQLLKIDPLSPDYLQKAFQLVGEYQSDPIALQKALLQNKQLESGLVTEGLQQKKLKADTALTWENQARVKAERLNLGSDTTPGLAFSGVSTGNTKDIANIASLVSGFKSVNAQKMFADAIRGLAEKGDNKGIAEKIIGTALSNIADPESRKRVNGGFQISQQLTRLEGLLGQYEAAGGNTGFFSGNIQSLKQKVGQVGDPRLANLATQMLNTLDTLARSRTGAVITKSEENLYNRMLPGIDKVKGLNKQVINGLRDSLMFDVESQLRYSISSEGVDYIKQQLPEVFGGEIQSESTHVYNGVTYKKINGQWIPQ